MKRHRLTRTLLATAWLAGGCAAVQAAAYECRLGSDGAWRPMAQDLAARFPAVVAECRPVVLPAAFSPASGGDSGADPDADLDADPKADGPDADAPIGVRVISARAPARRTAAAWQAPEAWDELIAWSAERHEVDPRLVQAVIQVESAFMPGARSPKGAIGLMQLMPATGLRFGAPSVEALRDPAVNIDAGVRYLRVLLDLFGERVELALAAYNAGEGAVMRHGNCVPPYRETQDYVRKVRRLYDGREATDEIAPCGRVIRRRSL